MPPTREPENRRSSRPRRLRTLLATFAAASATVAAMLTLGTQSASAASLTEVTNFGSNPGNLRMYEYIPNSVKANPAILVAVHYCTGTGPAFYSGTEFHSLADQYGFIVIYPDANVSGQCFDVSTSGALTHNGNSDPASIAQMVSYVKQHTSGAGSGGVYVTGASSGAMMTDVLLGDYPDIFSAGSAFMGVPFGCFATNDGSGWNSACSQGQITHTPQEWGDMVRAAYPGYSGARPRVQLWHGTADTTLNYHNFGEEIKQWTNVLGVSQTPVLTDSPQSGWTRTRYGANVDMAPVEAISVQGVGHSLPTSGMAAKAIHFFGLDGTASGTAGGTSTGTTTSGTTTSGTTTGSTTGTTTSGTTTGSTTGTTTSGTTTGSTTGTTTSGTTTGSTTSGTTGGSTGGNPGQGCTAAYTTVNSWPGGFQSSVTVTNTGSSAISGWKVSWTEPSGSAITQMWNAVNSGTTGAVTATNASYNGTLGGGASTTFGFTGSGSAPSPTLTCTAS